MSEPLKIHFVDDDATVLQGLRRMLHRMRHEWDMRFFSSGAELLENLRINPPQVIVADMRMPGMTGAELLAHVKASNPEIIRLILSGYSDQERCMQTIGVAHQFLNKPCEPETLHNAICGILQIQGLMQNEKLLRLVAGIDHLPSLPNLYLEIKKELSSDDPSLERVIENIQIDPALTLKILQLVNSGFFGLPRRISEVTEAAQLLGVENLQSIVLYSGIYSQIETKGQLPICYEEFSAHAMTVGHLAQAIGQMLNLPVFARKETFTAGVLHDMGKLIFGLHRTEAYRKVLAGAKQQGYGLSELERSVFGVCHGELGSYLLGLWGLPSSLVEAVAFHNRPSLSTKREVSTLAAVHIADVLANWNLRPNHRPTLDFFDRVYLEEISLAERLPEFLSLREDMGLN